ncbi:Neuroendocrine protein 7B2 [Aphelenchoides besseyi]|nr:Neuroendocrine protein 7B2 [Aphelenchoides besseyi]
MAATCFAARLVFCVVVCAIGVIAGEFGGNFYPDSDFIDLISRDIESLPGPMAFGHKYITGGAGEGDQQLHPDGDFESRQDVKSDNVLPAYCEPPNPCPVGYSAQDGCLENFENTADFSRNYQAQQECLCDHEHMFNCPTKDKDGYENEMNEMLDRNGLHKNMIAKKFHEKRSDNEEPRRKKRSAGFQKPQTRSNPYLNGEPLHTVSKKNGRHLY